MITQGTPAAQEGCQNVKVRIRLGDTKSYIDIEIDAALDYKIRQATVGMITTACYNRLVRLGNGNAPILADYLLAYKREYDTRATNCLNMAAG